MSIAALVAQQNVKYEQRSALLDLTHCYTMDVLHYWQRKKNLNDIKIFFACCLCSDSLNQPHTLNTQLCFTGLARS